MTAADFRRLALSFPEATESAHMDYPDFRVHGKIFATLGYPEMGVGMVKLFPDQQQEFVRHEPNAFAPVNGAWGRRGATHVRLKAAKMASVRLALAAAWRNTAPKGLAEKFESTGRGKRRD
jgi:hypothetical protein